MFFLASESLECHISQERLVNVDRGDIKRRLNIAFALTPHPGKDHIAFLKPTPIGGKTLDHRFNNNAPWGFACGTIAGYSTCDKNQNERDPGSHVSTPCLNVFYWIAPCTLPVRSQRHRWQIGTRPAPKAADCWTESGQIGCAVLSTFAILHIPHYPFFLPGDYEFYMRLCSCGLSHAFRLLNHTSREYSWVGRTGDGYATTTVSFPKT